jgi:uncharacterized protein (DUF488 family)
VEIYTIGFTQKSAAEFFGALKRAGIKRLIDVRLNNTSQLAGFAKRDDLEFFLKKLCAVKYLHRPDLAPTQEILHEYKSKAISWDEYARRFLALLEERRAEHAVSKRLFRTPTVLLCGEPGADRCHRRLVAEYLRDKWGAVTITHL